MSRILIVDDEPALCWSLTEVLTDAGHQVRIAGSLEQARERLAVFQPEVIVVDVRLPGADGLAALQEFRDRLKDVPVIVMTAFGDLPTAARAFSGGAFEYLVKPFDLNSFAAVVQRALSGHEGMTPENGTLPESGLVGHCPAMQAVYRQIALIAPTPFPVLLLGETGTGKELAARAIHNHSAVAAGPFIPVCPASLNPALIESELFGHVRGAFTGADENRRGLFEAAENGTLFLDEIADTPVSVQVKLLRVLESRRFSPVGTGEERVTSARFIAATHRNIREMIAAGTFREDLYHRLSAFTVHMPPLRDRSADIPVLLDYFLRQLPESLRPRTVSPQFSDALCVQHWSGNVRQLRNAVDHAVVMCRGQTLRPEHLPVREPFPDAGEKAGSLITDAIEKWVAQQMQSPTTDLYETAVRLLEGSLIPAVMRQTGHNRTAAARVLGMDRATLRTRLKDLDPIEDTTG